MKVMKELEKRVQRDEGGRGIARLVTGEVLGPAVEAMCSKERIGILTGFPCLIGSDPPIESDGIAGAFSIARALEQMGRSPTILIDSFYKEYLVELSTWHNTRFRSNIRISSSFHEDFDGIIGIERSGKAKDGKYYTMKGIEITDYLSSLDTAYFNEEVCSLGIGDGGNEAGLGNLKGLVEQYIPQGGLIGSVVRSDFPLISSVSTWGGYAVSIALSVHSGTPCCVETEGEREIALQIAELGIKDGILREAGSTIDGLPWDFTAGVIKDLLTIAYAN